MVSEVRSYRVSVFQTISIASRSPEKTDKCEVLQELIDCGKISAKQAKSIQKA